MAAVLETSYQTVVVDGDERAVHFDDACIVIPPQQRSRMPRLLQKSYSLPPLFRRRESQSPNPIDEAAKQDVIPHTSKPSIVSLWAKKAPAGVRRRASSGERNPLTPCLVQHDPSAPHRARARRPSLPASSPHSSTLSNGGGQELHLIPLRPCCSNCFHVTEACLDSGDAWRERFTRAARNRRNASADYQMSRAEKRDNVDVASPPATPGSFEAVTVDEAAKVQSQVLPKSDDGSSSPHDSREPTPEETEADMLLPVPEDVILDAMLSRRMLSPIPSRSASSEDVTSMQALPQEDTCEATVPEDADLPPFPMSASPPASPPPRTPSPPTLSPTSSPKSRFRIPGTGDILRVGFDVIKGVGSMSPTL